MRELEYALGFLTGWQGVVAARRAVAHVDPASESPLESRSRGWFIDAGIRGFDVGMPIPVGSHLYWADFCDRERRIIGEADGWTKYGDDTASIREALAREKRRQAELEADGWRVVRWTSDDSADSVVHRWRQARRSD
jgi:very-short-patch-repair endonuclease